jgi:NADH dehydrogenase (ubiquinone) 1 alpha/beta subcomplex 1
VEVLMALEEEFGIEIPDQEADKLNSVSAAIKFIQQHPKAQ